MSITYDRATTKLIYGIPPELEYGRWMNTFADGSQMWAAIANQKVRGLPGVLNSWRILVIGCGCGYLVEGLKDFSFSRVWGIDMGPYFPMLWGPTPVVVGGVTLPIEVRADVRPLLGQFDSRTITNTQMRGLTGTNNFRADLVVTEDILPGFTQAELPAVLNSCDAWLAAGGKVLHIVTEQWPSSNYGSGAPPWTLAEWNSIALAGRTSHSAITVVGVG